MNNLKVKLRHYWRARQYARRWDPGEIRFLRQYLKFGQTAFDIGSNKGGYLYWMRKAVGPAGSVYAFEPQPLLYEYLLSSVRSFGWENVEVENMGLGDQTADMELYIPGKEGDTSPGASFNTGKHGGEDYYIRPTPVTTLDEYTRLHDIGQIHLMKVDVEGFEYNVFKGADNILASQLPALLFESEQRHLASNSLEDIFDYLFQFDYDGYFFYEEKLWPLNEFDRETHQKMIGEEFWKAKGYCNNFLFVPIGTSIEL
jgi:FkbM family methyltransferase